MQQTQVAQGQGYYLRFIERFADSKSLSLASVDEVLLYWKGLGYYSRAINLHRASQQIENEFGGKFPTEYSSILKLSGVGKYTAAAITSICFNEPRAAVDGNLFRVLSRYFADGFEITNSGAFSYFSDLALRLMPQEEPGNFNQAMMDLGATICRARNPICQDCPLNTNCLAYMSGRQSEFPQKERKTKVEDLALKYYFLYHKDHFLIRQRDESSIWKRLYEFPQTLDQIQGANFRRTVLINHKLSHKNLSIEIDLMELSSLQAMESFSAALGLETIVYREASKKSFPRPLEKFIEEWARHQGLIIRHLDPEA